MTMAQLEAKQTLKGIYLAFLEKAVKRMQEKGVLCRSCDKAEWERKREIEK